LAGGLLGHQTAAERHEKDDTDALMDDIDAEEEFFHEPRSLGVAAPALVAAIPFSAVNVLTSEHREIAPLLIALSAWAKELMATTDDGRVETARFVGVLRSFVTDWHHAREEGILFQTLDLNCPAHERGPVAATVCEHGQLNGLLASMDELSRLPAPWSAQQREEVAHAASSYCELLHRDIATEEAVVFPMAEARLSASSNEMGDRFEAFTRTMGAPLTSVREVIASLVLVHPPADRRSHPDYRAPVRLRSIS